MASTDIDGSPIVIFGREDAEAIFVAAFFMKDYPGPMKDRYAKIAKRVNETFNFGKLSDET